MLDVLLVEDDEDVRECIASSLEDAGHRVVQASDGLRAAALLDSRVFDVTICDVHLPSIDGLTLARRARTVSPGTAIIVMSNQSSVPDAVATFRDGAVDYVPKPFDADELVARVIAPIAERRALRKKFDAAREHWVNLAAGERIVAASSKMRALVDRLKIVAGSDACVLLHGERGSGKKTLARLIHEESPRRLGPYVVVPCETLAETMIEAEVRGMTNASGRDEWFRQAEGGTLVLDGIDRIPLAAQSTLARVLSEPAAMAHRRGDRQPCGVRVVATAPSDLFDAVTAGRLVEPLFFRLTTATAAVPPLREREEDLLPLIVVILSSLAPSWASPPSIEPSAHAALGAYDFPGNVAELVWALTHAFSMADTASIAAEHLPRRIAGRPEPEAGTDGMPM